MIINNKQKGSALVIALLMMGILMTLALGLSDLIIRETIVTRDIVNSQKAFYAAEAGIESALLDLHQYLPGYQTDTPKGENDTDPKFSYTIKNRTKVIPHVDTELISREIATGAPQQYLYNVLKLNESITIPLFYTDNNGKEKPVTSFRVEYFIDAAISFQWSKFTTQQIPMLRWKITGIGKKRLSDRILTETIGDYLGVMVGSDADKPSCLGTNDKNATGSITVDNITYPQSCNGGIWYCARESFKYELVGDEIQTLPKKSLDITSCAGDVYTISEFIDPENHEKNYLTLSNIFNPSVLEGFVEDQKNMAKIYYRILITGDDEYTVPKVAEISSTGFAGRLRHEINAFIQSQSFLPVFNYSLYRTDVSSINANKESPAGKNAVP